jgi:AhpD family alkylhydroperoxidase
MRGSAFDRRIYTPSTFAETMRDVIEHMGDLRNAARGGRVDGEIAQKIMLVVSRVNGCRYCIYGHSRTALVAGVSEEELQSLLSGESGAFSKEEAVALTFAQHYAESFERPNPIAWQRLVDCYGLQPAQDILAYLRMITMGNLLGNTFDALLSRFLGKPARESSLWSEAGVLIAVLFVFPIGMLIRSAVIFFRRPHSSSGTWPV